MKEIFEHCFYLARLYYIEQTLSCELEDKFCLKTLEAKLKSLYCH